MDLYTRCSSCDTVFRVTTRHLEASGGQVRCGRCETVFDAFASLTAMPPGEGNAAAGTEENPGFGDQVLLQSVPGAQTETAEVDRDDLAFSPAETVATGAGAVTTGQNDAAPGETESGENNSSGNEPARFDSTETGSSEGEEDVVEPQPDAAPEADNGEPVAGDAAANLYEWEFKPAPKLASTRLWLSLSLLMLAGVLVQAGVVFRTEVLVNVPQAKPVYQQICRWLSCEIGLPRLADQLNIDASDLQLVDPRKPNIVKLTALVRNRARVPVEYPAFELTLTNAREQVVARRVFMPAEYLAGDVRTETGLPGRQELSVNLYLDTGPLRAAGYRIYLFYPS
jgi:predicted Zn finger-like uncharacterized protein